ncbi:MAG: hypothetical protein M1831_001290 [Alyxoria varia]|nr:MAG: hypothetical protein M1831_001290 [Alyxoria varia]
MATQLTGNDQITIDVGGRLFKTAKSTLEGSKILANWMSNNDRNSGPTNTLFLDFEPDAFAYVLAFLRGGQFPLIWNKEKGFDYGMYAQICRLAVQLELEQLKFWIQGGYYKKAIEVTETIEYTDIVGAHKLPTVTAGNQERWISEPILNYIKPKYVCPAGHIDHVPVHDRCSCVNRLSPNEWPQEQHRLYKVMAVTRTYELSDIMLFGASN